jgi:hypothetical protein
MQLLQHMFDRFDKLADVFQVQKVRKTANESYLAAAGLPDPDLLPSETDRACGIAGEIPYISPLANPWAYPRLPPA